MTINGLILAVALTAGITTVATAQQTLYTLAPVLTLEDVTACVKSAGKAAILYELDADGNTVGEPSFACAVAVK